MEGNFIVDKFVAGKIIVDNSVMAAFIAEEDSTTMVISTTVVIKDFFDHNYHIRPLSMSCSISSNSMVDSFINMVAI